MPGDIIRPAAMYKQLATAIAEAITAGEYQPGAPLPSETQLIDRYHVSRPTVRAAIAELRSMGMVESRHGKGSFVRTATTPSATIDRAITRDGSRHHTSQNQLDQDEPPTITRTHTTGIIGKLLDRGDEPAFSTDRLLTEPATGTRIMHHTVIPFEVAEQVPQLAECPDATPDEIYDQLTAAGHTLTWTETVTARAPLPDERTALRMPDATPILISHRVTHGTDDRPLLLEELRFSATAAQLAYRITASAPCGAADPGQRKG